ncbi:MAG: DNA repair protein RecN, partial [Pedosphaera parvula]|nr:DNA repair protein RecN [Pedosphaera parvula]
LEPLRGEFADLLRRRNELTTAKAGLIVDEKTYAQQLDLLRHQSNEIAAARLQPDVEAQVAQDHQRASNAARLLQHCQTALALLGDEENSLSVQAGILGRTLQELHRVDAAGEQLVNLQDQLVATMQELQREVQHYADRVDMDPERLRELEERLNLIHSLKRKYGSTLAEVIAFGEDAAASLRSLEQRDAELSRINAELEKLDRQLLKTGQELSAQRRKIIPKLGKAAEKQLADLGFRQSRFDVELTCAAAAAPNTEFRVPNATGFDTIEFQFAPNPGEPARPLRAIASSGEMARVMLALKTVLAAQDEVPVLVFDEVDANVGGETAGAVGDKMRQIGAKHQVLCITHLAPVAACSRVHFVVNKRVI